jgi:hypothetical protein
MLAGFILSRFDQAVHASEADTNSAQNSDPDHCHACGNDPVKPQFNTRPSWF